MKILLHTCCAPCLIYPLSTLINQGEEVTAYFYNPNIHPYLEFKKRCDCLKEYSQNVCFPLISEDKYELKEFLRKIVFNENERCLICYFIRLEKTAHRAKELGFDAFTTTLLYSRYQKHDDIKSLCSSIAARNNIPFVYYDFRSGWLQGIDTSKKLNMYRQSYCGCIYSEQERYDKSLKQLSTSNNKRK
jgi:epoxyqueuosine reductase